MRVKVEMWGSIGDWMERQRKKMPSYAIVMDHETAAEAIARCISQAAELRWSRRPVEIAHDSHGRHYRGSLGRKLRGNSGYSTECMVCFAVPIVVEETAASRPLPRR